MSNDSAGKKAQAGLSS
jgi:hypothetical protein